MPGFRRSIRDLTTGHCECCGIEADLNESVKCGGCGRKFKGYFCEECRMAIANQDWCAWTDEESSPVAPLGYAAAFFGYPATLYG